MIIIEAMHAHRSIRVYKTDPVPDELLAEILQAGIRASSLHEQCEGYLMEGLKDSFQLLQ